MTKNEIPNITYSSIEFFDILLSCCDSTAPLDQQYSLLRRTFRRIVEQYISDCPINFVGTFAKVDYIIKQNSILQSEAMLIHRTRKRLFSLQTNDEGVTLSYDTLIHDVKATAILVSHIFSETIPSALSALLPTTDDVHSWGIIDHNVLRVIVTQWDDAFVWATDESGKEIKVCYSNDNEILTRGGKFCWNYLSDILSENCQLNLVRVRMKNNIHYPELIIYEPDYLINVTTIANCFETYAESPLVSLINKLRPAANGIPIHLGNLAGQYLDDTIHKRNISFADSFMEFFSKNALALVTCEEMFQADKAKAFYENAKVQKENIKRFVDSHLPDIIGQFSSDDVLLEPSFFSATLGIQGRFDFLIDNPDKTVIIEQKSGKGAYVPPSYNHDPQVPAPQEKHLVQLMLYRALMAFEFSRHSDQLSHIILMYSKYAKGLVSTAQIPDIMLRAIRMRNLIAHSEIGYADSGMDILETLTPDILNEKRINGKLWHNYILPQLTETLLPIRQASPLERSYYLRFMHFLAKEQMLSKVGNKNKECSGFASVWNDTLDDKRNAGSIYDSLTISDYICDGSNVTGIILRFGNINADSSNFRVGDIVILYPYRKGETPFACSQMVHRATISQMNAETIEIKLRNTQSGKHIFESMNSCLWAIEHDLMEASESSLYRSMHSFLSATQKRRDLILSQRMPDIDDRAEVYGNYGVFNSLVSNAAKAKDLYIIIGPPGTGKTSFGLVNILSEELLRPESSILLLSYTNRAVDEICSKLVEEGHDFIRIGSELSCPKTYRDHLLSRRVKACRKGTEVRDMLLRQRIVCATTASLNSSVSLLNIKHFSLAIIDEASQILEPHIIGLLSARHNDGTDSILRTVLIGDHKQLPAVVQQTEDESAVSCPLLNSIGIYNCRTSFFERMLARFRKDNGDYDNRYVYMLTHQGRMHHDIAEFPNQEFYNGKLSVVPLPHQTIALAHPTVESPHAKWFANHRVAFIDIPSPQQSASDKVNMMEAEVIAATVLDIYNQTSAYFDINKTVGIIVPYRNQISAVRNAIDAYGISILHDITIDTVERYQGSQRDFIIYGFTVQHAYQLNFLTSTSFYDGSVLIDRKLNVAMTRARLHLLLFGNAHLLSRTPIYQRLIDYTKQHNSYFASTKDFTDLRFSKTNSCLSCFSLT